MKKIFKSISASVTAFIIASTMVVSASAASSADVVSAAKSAGVPSNHVSELKNYLDSHASKFSSADYDYMVKALSDCGATYVQPVADKLFGAGTDLASLTNDQLRQVFKEMGEDSRKAIAFLHRFCRLAPIEALPQTPTGLCPVPTMGFTP